jgi:hypothetical protein
VIEEVYFNSPGADDGSNRSLNGERVEIWNNSRRTKQLEGWKLRDRDGNVFRFPELSLDRGDFVRVHTGRGEHQVFCVGGGPGSYCIHELYWGSDSYIWDNKGDVVTLKAESGRVVDRCRYSKEADSPKRC